MPQRCCFPNVGKFDAGFCRCAAVAITPASSGIHCVAIYRNTIYRLRPAGLNGCALSATSHFPLLTFHKQKLCFSHGSPDSRGTQRQHACDQKQRHRAGYRFRKNVKDLPGKPDIVLPKYRTVIFVHGCFWHRHKGCKDATTPKSNIEFWEKKFERNISNDRKHARELRKLARPVA